MKKEPMGATENHIPANGIVSIYGIENVARGVEGKVKSGTEFVIYNKSKADHLLSSYTHNGTLGSAKSALQKNNNR